MVVLLHTGGVVVEMALVHAKVRLVRTVEPVVVLCSVDAGKGVELVVEALIMSMVVGAAEGTVVAAVVLGPVPVLVLANVDVDVLVVPIFDAC